MQPLRSLLPAFLFLLLPHTLALPSANIPTAEAAHEPHARDAAPFCCPEPYRGPFGGPQQGKGGKEGKTT